ncbi:MAG: UDP-glucose 4-epimerase GalE [Dongiaceae bacterium]
MTPAILVPGGAGYIGSAACHALAAAGYLPVVVDNLSTGHDWAVRWGPFERIDIMDRDALIAVMRRHDVRAVMHFAAHALVAESIRHPDRYFQNNFAGSMVLLEAMKHCEVDTFVFSSTGAVYGYPKTATIAEDHPREPINPYGLSKKLIEDALPWYGSAYGIKWVALRYFNAAGAMPEEGIGEAHTEETHLIPLAADAALGVRGPVSIMGTDYPTPDGTAVRDYVHIADLADAHVLTLHYLLEGGASDIFNLGTGHGCSVRDVVLTTERISGSKYISRIVSRRPGDPPYLVADSSKAMTTLGWRPQRSDLDTIVGTALTWHRAESNRGGRIAATPAGS